MKFKTLKQLKREFGYRDHTWGIQLKNCDGIGIVEEMFWIFDGKDKDVKIDREENHCLGIHFRKPGELSYGFSWQIHKNWIDNNIHMPYNEVMDLFKEPL